MLADSLITPAAYVEGFLGAAVLLWIVVHVYAWSTIRNIDRSE
jgi:hypothetical protein